MRHPILRIYPLAPGLLCPGSMNIRHTGFALLLTCCSSVLAMPLMGCDDDERGAGAGLFFLLLLGSGLEEPDTEDLVEAEHVRRVESDGVVVVERVLDPQGRRLQELLTLDPDGESTVCLSDAERDYGCAPIEALGMRYFAELPGGSIEGPLPEYRSEH